MAPEEFFCAARHAAAAETVASTGVDPIDMTVFNGSVLFNGVDTAGHQGLWITNGTGAGTQELTVGSTASATGIDPTDMTVLNGEVLFNGVDADGLSGLWAWNGTSATELVPGGGTSSTKGPNPTHMTVFGNEVLFNGLIRSRPAVVGDKRDGQRHISTHGRRRRERFCQRFGYRPERPHGLQLRGPFQRP